MGLLVLADSIANLVQNEPVHAWEKGVLYGSLKSSATQSRLVAYRLSRSRAYGDDPLPFSEFYRDRDRCCVCGNSDFLGLHKVSKLQRAFRRFFCASFGGDRSHARPSGYLRGDVLCSVAPQRDELHRHARGGLVCCITVGGFSKHFQRASSNGEAFCFHLS